MTLMAMAAYPRRCGWRVKMSENLIQELLAVLTMMVGANITSSQLLSIAERMLLETDLDQVTF